MDVDGVLQYLSSLDILVSREWAESCINWCKEEKLSSNHSRSAEALRRAVYEQWLYQDLREITEVPLLPLNLAEARHQVLPGGNYALQLMHVVDIGKSKHSQLRKIREDPTFTGHQEEEQEEVRVRPNTKESRTLLLTLTDGNQEVEAFEYKPVECLNQEMAPGTKVRLTGPLQVRRGRILLIPGHVRVLGGNVDDLMVSHAYENILAGSLGLPLKEILIGNVPTPPAEPPVAPDQIPLVSERRTAPKQPPATPSLFAHQEELLIAQQMLVDDEEEFSFHNPVVQERSLERRSAPERSSPDMFDEDLDMGEPPMPAEASFPGNYEEDDFNDILGGIDVESHLDNALEGEVKSLSEIRCLGRHLARVKFEAVSQKLTLTDAGEYLLDVLVKDPHGSLKELRVHSNVVTLFAGCQPCQLIKMKEQVVKGNEKAVQQVFQAISRLKDKLVALDNLVEIEVVSEQELPLLLKIL